MNANNEQVLRTVAQVLVPVGKAMEKLVVKILSFGIIIGVLGVFACLLGGGFGLVKVAIMLILSCVGFIALTNMGAGWLAARGAGTHDGSSHE